MSLLGTSAHHALDQRTKGHPMTGWYRACNFGECAEAKLEDDVVRLRSTRMPSEEAVFTLDEWRQFCADIRAGKFDAVGGDR